MFPRVVWIRLKHNDQENFPEFLPSLEAELHHIGGQVGSGYPAELSDYLSHLKDAFEERIKAGQNTKFACQLAYRSRWHFLPDRHSSSWSKVLLKNHRLAGSPHHRQGGRNDQAVGEVGIVIGQLEALRVIVTALDE